MQLVLVARDLLAWTRLLCLDGDQRPTHPIPIAAGWPWVDQLVNAFARVHTLSIKTTGHDPTRANHPDLLKYVGEGELCAGMWLFAAHMGADVRGGGGRSGS